MLISKYVSKKLYEPREDGGRLPCGRNSSAPEVVSVSLALLVVRTGRVGVGLRFSCLRCASLVLNLLAFLLFEVYAVISIKKSEGGSLLFREKEKLYERARGRRLQ